MEMKFFPDLAPKHVENFVKLAKAGFYNGTIFHRVVPGFMIQGGDPNTKNSLRKETFGQGGPKDDKGKPILLKAEFSDTPHKRGIVSMARASEPDTAGSQFFIVVEDSFFLDRKYTVFGEVTKGLGIAVIDARGVVPNEFWGWVGESPDRSHFTEPGHQGLSQFLLDQAAKQPAWRELGAP